MDSALSHSRPLGQSLPLAENVWVLSICMLPCRRSSHGDSSPSLRLFALGLRPNKCRLMEPCCLDGSPFSFIDQARGVLLFVLLLTLCRFLLSAALLDISFCFLIFLFFCFSLWRGSFLLLVSRVSFLLSSHFLASVLVSCLRCVHRWSARSSSRVTFSASAVPVVLDLGLCCWHTVCSDNPFSGRAILQSTGSSAYCPVRMAGCPLHSA